MDRFIILNLKLSVINQSWSSWGHCSLLHGFCLQAVNSWPAGPALHALSCLVPRFPRAHVPGHLQPLAADVQLPRGGRHLS